MSDGAIKTLKDRRKLHLEEIARLQASRVAAAQGLIDIDKAIARCGLVVSEMEDGITALGGTID